MALARDANELERRYDMVFMVHMSGWTPLMWAGYRRDPQVLNALLAANADTRATDQYGRNALHLVMESTQPAPAAPCIDLLIRAGAFVDHVDRNGFTSLHKAVQRGDLGAASMLIDHGADVNARDSHGETALVIALSSRASEAMVKLLLDRGADARMKTPNGRGMLELAELLGVAPEMRELLRQAIERH
ncbi:MAG: ankyrin repeat domain-containing protein [Planctomycetota bacterium]|nr:ankyrin repeat domain-containing protein [Planctomycetota bacterium]